jgi:hypothetical protein
MGESPANTGVFPPPVSFPWKPLPPNPYSTSGLSPEGLSARALPPAGLPPLPTTALLRLCPLCIQRRERNPATCQVPTSTKHGSPGPAHMLLHFWPRALAPGWTAFLHLKQQCPKGGSMCCESQAGSELCAPQMGFFWVRFRRTKGL